jgi:RNA polymerase sigma-70 factor (ECF subfamily)
MPTQPYNSIATRATLLARLKNLQDQGSWQEFFNIYWKLIYGVARKAGMTDVEAQDIVQETMVSVVKHVGTFNYDPAIGSFKGWLLKMTRWRILDQLRKRGPARAHRRASSKTATSTDTIENVVDPASQQLDKVWDVEWERTLLDAAVDKVKRRVDPQKYQIFDFYVNKEWKAEKVATTFGVTVDQVYLAKHRITDLIKEEVRRLEKETT